MGDRLTLETAALLAHLRDWLAHYPEDVFAPPPKFTDPRERLLSTVVAAQMGRHVLRRLIADVEESHPRLFGAYRERPAGIIDNSEPSEIIVSGHDFDRMASDAPPTEALVELFREHGASIEGCECGSAVIWHNRHQGSCKSCGSMHTRERLPASDDGPTDEECTRAAWGDALGLDPNGAPYSIDALLAETERVSERGRLPASDDAAADVGASWALERWDQWALATLGYSGGVRVWGRVRMRARLAKLVRMGEGKRGAASDDGADVDLVRKMASACFDSGQGIVTGETCPDGDPLLIAEETRDSVIALYDAVVGIYGDEAESMGGAYGDAFDVIGAALGQLSVVHKALRADSHDDGIEGALSDLMSKRGPTEGASDDGPPLRVRVDGLEVRASDEYSVHMSGFAFEGHEGGKVGELHVGSVTSPGTVLISMAEGASDAGGEPPPGWKRDDVLGYRLVSEDGRADITIFDDTVRVDADRQPYGVPLAAINWLAASKGERPPTGGASPEAVHAAPSKGGVMFACDHCGGDILGYPGDEPPYECADPECLAMRPEPDAQVCETCGRSLSYYTKGGLQCPVCPEPDASKPSVPDAPGWAEGDLVTLDGSQTPGVIVATANGQAIVWTEIAGVQHWGFDFLVPRGDPATFDAVWAEWWGDRGGYYTANTDKWITDAERVCRHFFTEGGAPASDEDKPGWTEAENRAHREALKGISEARAKLTALIGAVELHHDELRDHAAGGCTMNVATMESEMSVLRAALDTAKGPSSE